MLGPEPRLAHALLIAVSTLIVACPCALGLATPMSMTVAMGRGAQAGVLFRNAESLELLEEVDTLVLDKTGTLTTGRPEVVTVIPVDDVAESELLRYAASLEQASEHPIAAAVVRIAQGRGLRLGRTYGFKATPGAGASGVVQMRNVAVGNARLMEDVGVDVGALEREAERLRVLGQTIVFVAVDRIPIGLLGIADPLKPDSWDAVQEFKREGLRVVLLSGDHADSVRAVAQQLGIEEVHAGVMPEEKAAVIRALRADRAQGRDGGRRHQRRPGARRGGRRHRDGRGHRHRQADGRRDADDRRPARHRARAAAERGHDVQRPPEPVVRLRLQRARRADRRRHTVSADRACCSRRRSRPRPCRSARSA